MFPPMTLRGAVGLIALIWLRLLDPAGLAWAGGYTVRPSQPTVQYNTNLNSGYLSSAITPSLVNTQIADQGIPQNSTTAATGYNWNQVYAGDPVNLVTGNFYHNERDIHIPGRGGLDLVFERSYNSHNPKDGPLGYGWTHSFNHYLTFYGAEDSGNGPVVKVSWTDGTGGEKFFALTGGTVPANSPAFSADPGVYDTLKRQAGGDYTITQSNGLTYTFRALNTAWHTGTTAGVRARLTAITDRNGNTLTLHYDPNHQQLSQVQDALGRTLSFAYQNPGGVHRIHTVTDYSGRIWRYTIDAAGDLTDVRHPLASTGQPAPNRYSYYTAQDGSGHAHRLKRKENAEGHGLTFEYYANGQVFRHTDDLGASMRFRYNAFRRETVVTDERGFSRRHFFDRYGNPVKIVDSDGASETFDYDPNAPLNRTAHTDKAGLTTHYQYDSSGNLIQITRPSGATETYSHFNAFHQAGKRVDANGHVTLLQYDSHGNLLERIQLKAGIDRDPAGYNPVAADVAAWTRYQYDSVGNRTQSRRIKAVAVPAANSQGPRFTVEYDSNQLYPVQTRRCGQADLNQDGVTDPEECQSQALVFDSLGRLEHGVDAAWYPTEQHYDALGRLTRSSDALGRLHDLSYDSDGRLQERHLTLGNVRHDSEQHRYGALGRLIETIDAGGHATRYRYDAAGHLTRITDPDNYSVSFDYDERGHWLKAYDQEGHHITRSLDGLGRIRSRTDANGNRQRLEYYGASQDGRLFRQYDAVGRVNEFHYDALGQVTAFIDPEAHTTTSAYDELGRVVRVVQPGYQDTDPDSPNFGQTVHPVTRYHYNLLGQLTDIEAGATADPNDAGQDQVTLKQHDDYDDFGRLLQSTDALGRSRHNRYDNHDQVIEATDGNGDTTTFVWQQGGLLTEKDNTAGKVEYFYNALGQVTQAQQHDLFYSYQYDAAHRLASVSDFRPQLAGTNAKVLNYRYSPGGLLDAFWDDSGDRTDYRYDPAGRLTSLWDGNWETTRFRYDEGGRLTQQVLPNGIRQNYQYQDDDRLARLTATDAGGTDLLDQAFHYDPSGRLDQLSEILAGTAQTSDYQYDALGRLLEADNHNPAQLQTWHYDATGNCSRAQTGTDPAHVAIVDAADQLLEIRSGSKTGSLLEAFVYDGNGQLVKHCVQGTVTRSATDCSGSSVTQLDYDANQRLVQVQKTGQATETYRYDPQGRRIETVAGGQTTRFHYNGDNLYAEYHNGFDQPAYRYVQTGLDQPLGRYDDSSARYYLQGGLNNILGLSDDQGQLTASQRYDAWGNTVEHTGTVPQYGYQAREPNTAGLIYYRARYYQPHTGRFTQPDPKGFIDGINRYAYAVNSPVNYADPYGTSVIPREYNTLASQQQSYYSTPASTSTSGLNPSSGSVFTGESYQVAANLGPGCPAGLGVCGVQGGGGGGSIAGAGSIGRVAGGGSVAKGSGEYSVGPYNVIKGSVPGLDAHHVGQKALMKEMITGYNPTTAPSILVPKVGHTIKGPNGIVSRSTEGLAIPRDVLARDIQELRRVYPDVPNHQLQELIRMNKDAYPGAFTK